MLDRTKYNAVDILRKMQSERINPTRPKHQSGSVRQCVQGASGCPYSGSTCNCSYCRSTRTITRPKDAGLVLRAQLDRYYADSERAWKIAQENKKLWRLHNRNKPRENRGWDSVQWA